MITLTSDFGSPYPAAMKGVILERTDVRLVDVTHSLPRQDVQAAAFWLREVLPHFPPAVHLAVVDPGVGTDRAALVIRADDHALVGPDNGVLLPAARRLANVIQVFDEEGLEVFEIDVEDPESQTFHGRDVFAPAAADVHEAGVEAFEDLPGIDPADDYVDFSFPDPEMTGSAVAGEVLVVDGFGNAITNIPGDVLDGHFGESITVNAGIAPVRRTYAEVNPGDRVVTVGSHGNVELAANEGRGDEEFDVSVGSTVQLVPR